MRKIRKLMGKDEINNDNFLIALVNSTETRDITTFINKLFNSIEEAEEYVNSHSKISDSFKFVVIYKLQGYTVYLR